MKFALYNFQLPVFELFIIHVTDLSVAMSDLSLVKLLLSERQIGKPMQRQHSRFLSQCLFSS